MIQQPAYHPTQSQYASAASHLDLRAEWSPVYRIDGVRYVTVVSGTSGHRYAVRADSAGCSCLFYAKCGGICSHRLAVILAATMDELAEQQGIRQVRGRFEGRAQEDEVVPTFREFAASFYGCIEGCGQLTERRMSRCDVCSAQDVSRAEQEAKRENQAALQRANALLFGEGD